MLIYTKILEYLVSVEGYTIVDRGLLTVENFERLASWGRKFAKKNRIKKEDVLVDD